MSHCRGWNVGGRVDVDRRDDADVVTLALTGGSNDGSRTSVVRAALHDDGSREVVVWHPLTGDPIVRLAIDPDGNVHELDQTEGG